MESPFQDSLPSSKKRDLSSDLKESLTRAREDRITTKKETSAMQATDLHIIAHVTSVLLVVGIAVISREIIKSRL